VKLSAHWRDEIEEGVHLQVHIGRSAYLEADLFYGYLLDAMIPKIQEFREASETVNEPAIV
jgi:hypothetical protein